MNMAVLMLKFVIIRMLSAILLLNNMSVLDINQLVRKINKTLISDEISINIRDSLKNLSLN